jgi:hypothetical protein
MYRSVNSRHSADVIAAAACAFNYLSEVDPLPNAPCDAVIGFGTFDVTLASFCGELYAQRQARRIIFTGGFGAGTTDLGLPEADAWREELRRTHPLISGEHVITENRSTNTAENIEFTARLLLNDHGPLRFGHGLNTALIVASPSRLRRVKLTLRQLQPALKTYRARPRGNHFEHEFVLYGGKGLDFIAHLIGELDRITNYPSRGWIVPEPLPGKIVAALAVLKGR